MLPDLQNIQLRLEHNGKVKQDGNTAHMLTPVLPLITYMSRFFTLSPGDVILTGTPEGVGPISAGDEIRVSLDNALVAGISDIRLR